MRRGEDEKRMHFVSLRAFFSCKKRETCYLQTIEAETQRRTEKPSIVRRHKRKTTMTPTARRAFHEKLSTMYLAREEGLAIFSRLGIAILRETRLGLSTTADALEAESNAEQEAERAMNARADAALSRLSWHAARATARRTGQPQPVEDAYGQVIGSVSAEGDARAIRCNGQRAILANLIGRRVNSGPNPIWAAPGVRYFWRCDFLQAKRSRNVYWLQEA